jgi:hypothetical protein
MSILKSVWKIPLTEKDYATRATNDRNRFK